MLGVTRLPSWVDQALATFGPLFSDRCNVDSFIAFVSVVIMTEAQWSVSEFVRGISRPDEDAKSGSAYRYFLGGTDWSVTDPAQYHADYAGLGESRTAMDSRVHSPLDVVNDTHQPDFPEPAISSLLSRASKADQCPYICPVVRSYRSTASSR